MVKRTTKNYSAVIANRRSMRLLPKIWSDVVGDHYALDSTYNPIFSILRANFISGLKGSHRESKQEMKFLIAANNAREFLLSELMKYENSFGSFLNLSAAGYAADAISVSAYNNVLATAYYPYADKSEMMDWRALQADILRLTSNELISGWPLWGDVSPPLFLEWERVKEGLAVDKLDWSFWIKWYDAALNGEPLNYELLERIALIPSDDWEQGPAHVNGLIAKIETEFELKAKIAELEGRLLQISSSGRGIGDNQGPPMADEPVAKEIMIIWEPLQELKQEIEEKHPNREQLLAIAKKIGELSAAIFKWAAGLANFALKTYIGVAAAKLATVADPVATILSAIYDLVLKLVGYLP